MSESGASAHISVSNVSVDFGGKQSRVRVLSGVNLKVRRGGFASLIGPSGCGKSTLLKILSGLLTPSEGTVSVAGLRPQQAVLERRVGLVFQEATLMPWKTARQNVCLLMELSDKARTRAEINDRAEEMLRLVGLGHAMDRYPTQLSGGMRQRVSIARALALDPEVLLMDEPFGALDAITREEMCAFILEIWQRTGKTIVLVTHSIDEAVFLSEEVHVMATGPARILESLDVRVPYPRTDDSFTDPAFIEASNHLRRLLKASHARTVAP
ncbi:NitT/TauT family transport system ATP-binding protein [Pseudoxanthobacter soli DSM 19599]|uniref:NitT/TauT family transport system ATP-binding protein n=1 Tax=Pseudoxanthobacter soli DSM 19599 TaxID=1123029 RepID=A0A1M7ZPI6_9HYPH|nr:ABC transporter ATP-binding protein [Pseudoxanthobacter soli]SHO66719.1 NitT/TauT family transport system ATP-binding protein [Pseudoxanthobacter soli DSM 19599]